MAGGGGAQLDGLQLRAYPVQVTFTQQVTASDSTSITAYGQRSFPGELEFCNIYDADAVLESTVDMRAEPLPIVTVRFVIGTDSAKATKVLVRNLSDRVTIVEPETVLNNDFYLESFNHQMTSQYDHEVVVGCELVPPAGTVTPSNVFIIGSAVSGHQHRHRGPGRMTALVRAGTYVVEAHANFGAWAAKCGLCPNGTPFRNAPGYLRPGTPAWECGCAAPSLKSSGLARR